MSVTIIVGGALLLALVAFFVIYNGLVTLKNNVAKNWSNIDVLLKQRFDELPKLVAVCQRYMEHEKETLEGVTRARAAAANAGSAEDSPQAQNMISDALKSLFAVVENYPDLKADRTFDQLQGRISGLENEIADRREYYNDSVNIYNIGIEKLPDVFIARLINYRTKRLWQIDPAHRKDVSIKFGA
ncbi:MAG: LemA family protein [candidate division Zixibacteria bacterium]|nr:LemA family protein [candidate division Zixibacteria bacterium]